MVFVVAQKRLGEYIVNLVKEGNTFQIEVYKEGLIDYVSCVWVGADFDYAVKTYYKTIAEYEEKEAKGE